MARYKGWKPTAADLDRYRELYETAANVVQRAERAMGEELGYTSRQLEDALPEIGDIGVGDDLTSLRNAFANRNEFKRELTYLERIAKSETAKAGTKYEPMTYEAQGALTAGRVDPATGRVVTQFMERERALAKRRANDAALRLIRDAGIEMVRVPVLDSEGNQVTDEWRHKVFTYVPATPANERELRALEDQNPAAQYVPPEAASRQYVMKFGDLVRLGEVSGRRMSPKRIYESLHADRMSDMKNRLYFANYQNIIDTTIAGPIGEEISGYIDQIQQLDFPQRYRIYRLIEKSDAEYAQLDYVYEDTMSPTNIKMARMVRFWRSEVMPEVRKMQGEEEPPSSETADLEPVEPGDPSYLHIKGGPAMAAAGGEPTVYDAYQANAQPTGQRKRGRGGRLTMKIATGITLKDIENLFYGIAGA